MTDSELVEASRRGELAAFGQLVSRYQDVVCAVSYSSTGDRSLSEDVAQDTFVAAWRQIDRARPATLRQWLCGIARNLGHKALRKRRREAPLDDLAHAAPGATAFDDLARADAERLVRDALARVPEAYREVLVLYYREDKSIRDVAATLGIGEAAAMQRLSRARRYLADGLTSLVEHALRERPRRRDLAAAVLAAIAAFAIPARVDAAPSQTKGSTMLKLAIAASTLAAVGATAYLALAHGSPAPAAPPRAAALHYGAGAPRVPALGPTAPPHLVAAHATTIDDLRLIPADSIAVFGVDMARIQRSALWQQFAVPALANATGLRELERECGFDLLASLTSATVGVRTIANGSGALEPTVVLVAHGLPKAKTFACASHADLGDCGTIRVDGDTVLVAGSDSTLAGLTFVDDATALVVVGPDATKSGIANIAAGNAGAGASAYADLLGEINTDDALWFAVTNGSALVTAANTAIAPYSPVRLEGLYGSLDVTDALVLNAGARTGSPALAAALVAIAKQRLDQLAADQALRAYVDQLDIESDDGDIIVSAGLTASQLVGLGATVELGRGP